MEHPSIIFKIVCPDRPGLVSLLTSWISNYGGNIKHSDHHTDQDAGLFLSRIEWNSNNIFFNRDEIYKEFEKIADEVNGKFNVNYSDEIPNVAIFVSKQNHCLIDLLWRVRNGELKMKVPLIISNHSDLENIANDFNAKFVHIDTFKNDKSIVFPRNWKSSNSTRTNKQNEIKYHFNKIDYNRTFNFNNSNVNKTNNKSNNIRNSNQNRSNSKPKINRSSKKRP